MVLPQIAGFRAKTQEKSDPVGGGRGEEEYECIRSNVKERKGVGVERKICWKRREGKPRGSRLEPQDKRALSSQGL